MMDLIIGVENDHSDLDGSNGATPVGVQRLESGFIAKTEDAISVVRYGSCDLLGACGGCAQLS